MPVRYLDSQWTKAITVDSKGHKTGMKFILVNAENGKREERTYDYQESVSNALNPIVFRMKNIRYIGIFETFPDDATGLPVVSHYTKIVKG